MLIKLFFSFLKIGLFSLGGGYAMIPLISNEVVTVNHWLDPGELVDIIAVSQATPGPIAINCATFVGAKICGFTGAVVATLGVVIAPILIMILLGSLFHKYRDIGLVRSGFHGIRIIVVALILYAAISIFPVTFIDMWSVVLLAAVFVAVSVFHVDAILILIASGLAGFIIYK